MVRADQAVALPPESEAAPVPRRGRRPVAAAPAVEAAAAQIAEDPLPERARETSSRLRCRPYRVIRPCRDLMGPL
ncbi:hypothetical protein GCM10022206_08330 [Streptomyces chiangmaiensis]